MLKNTQKMLRIWPYGSAPEELLPRATGLHFQKAAPVELTLSPN